MDSSVGRIGNRRISAGLAAALSLGALLACLPMRGRDSGAAPAVGSPAAGGLPGCGKDTDCKGTRVCEHGTCVEPSAASRARMPPPAPPAAPPTAVPALKLGGPVPMFHDDPQHTGRSSFRAPPRRPREVWRFPTQGTVFSAAVLAEDGTVLFGSHDHFLYALTPEGALRWKLQTGDLVWATPALGPNGVVYAGSDDDKVYAANLADGTLRWASAFGRCRRAVGLGPEAARCDVDQLTLGPDGTIYAGGDGIYAIRPDGTLRWRFSPAEKAHCAGAPAVSPEGLVYAGCQDDAVYALDAEGNKRWEFRGPNDFDSTPALGPDGTVYIGSDDRRLYAFLPDGRLRFAVLTEGPVRSSPALGLDGTVYFGSYDGSLYAVTPEGTVGWSFRSADRIHSSPTVDAAGTVLFGSQDDRLYALLPDGKLLWSVLLDGDVDSTPVLGPDGTIYVGTDDRALHALR